MGLTRVYICIGDIAIISQLVQDRLVTSCN